MKSVKTETETKQEVKYGYNYKFQYVKAFNDYVYRYNGFNFDLFGKPGVKSDTSDKLEFLKYEVVNNIIENDNGSFGYLRIGFLPLLRNSFIIVI